MTAEERAEQLLKRVNSVCGDQFASPGFELGEQLIRAIASLIKRYESKILKEREACAKIAENYGAQLYGYKLIAQAIRARGSEGREK